MLTQDRVGGDQQPQSLASGSRFHAEQGRVRSADEILGTHKVDACAGIVSEGWTNAAPTLPANGTRYGPIFAVTTMFEPLPGNDAGGLPLDDPVNRAP